MRFIFVINFNTQFHEKSSSQLQKIIVKNNSTLVLHAGEEIALLPGTEIEFGSNLAAYIQSFNCANLLQRINPFSETNNVNDEQLLPEERWMVDEKYNRNSVRIFPNPASSSFVIEGLINGENYTIVLNDCTGKEIKTFQIKDSQNIFSLNENLKTGIYFILIKGKDVQTNHKLIIQN